jgi:hypothetical protein
LARDFSLGQRMTSTSRPDDEAVPAGSVPDAVTTADPIGRGLARERNRRSIHAYRRRQAAGLIIVRLELDEADITACLVADRLLDPAVADSRPAVEAALGELLRRYVSADRKW